MKIFVLSIKKSTLLNLVAITILIISLVFITINDSTAVFGTIIDPVYKGNENNPYIAFECNVVWGTEYVPQMLDIFASNDIKITFFIGGEWAEENHELLLRMVDEGHEIGNHGYGHKHHSKLNQEGNTSEIQMAEDIIKDIIGIRTSLFAPPYGEFNDVTLRAAKSLGYKTIMWSKDTIDWRRDGVDKIKQRVLNNPENGDLVLMHPTADTVKALPDIIETLHRLGFKVTSVSEAIE
ncbi:MAG TPA: polysaccharide deacetylase family protein [Bacillota bacterium]|nr:polysaccharide deacetylase family protein [Bacillota bacterium]